MCDGWDILWCIDNPWERETWSMLTMPGLSLWDCDCHGELFSHASFSIGSLDLYCPRRQESWRPIRKKLEDDRKTGSQLPLWHLLLPRVQTRCSLHIVTLNILKFCQGHPPSTTALTPPSSTWGEEWHLVTSINNENPDTLVHVLPSWLLWHL